MLPQLVRMSLLKREAVSQMDHYPHLSLAPQWNSPREHAAMHAELEELTEKLSEATNGRKRDAADAEGAESKLRSQLEAAEDGKAQLQQKLSEVQASLEAQQRSSRESTEVSSATWPASSALLEFAASKCGQGCTTSIDSSCALSSQIVNQWDCRDCMTVDTAESWCRSCGDLSYLQAT